MKIDDELVKLVKEIGASVVTLPAEVRQSAFEFLLQRHLGQQREVAIEVSTEGEESPAKTTDWATRLADSIGVSVDQVHSIIDVDEEGTIHVARQDLGDREAHINRNITLVTLWAARVLNRDVYFPATEIRRIIKELKLPSRNLENNLRRAKHIRSLSLRGQKMLQLTGNWQERVSDIFVEFST